jgi:hypothetical protein
MTAWIYAFDEFIQLSKGTIYLITIHQKLVDKPNKRKVMITANAFDDDDHQIAYCDVIGSYYVEEHERASELEIEAAIRINRMKALLRNLGVRHTDGIIAKSPYAGKPFTTKINESVMELLLENQIKKILEK